MDQLLKIVLVETCRQFGSRPKLVRSSTRQKPRDARTRAISMFVYSTLMPGKPCFAEVGRVFGRDRTTVCHALSRVRAWRESEEGFENALDNVIARTRARL